MNYFADLRALRDELVARPGLTFQGLTLLTPSTRPLVWSKWPKKRRAEAMRAPADFHPLYAQVETVALTWTCFDSTFSTQAVAGRVLLQSLDGLFYQGDDAGRADTGFWDEHLPAERQAHYRQYYLFDNLLHNTNVVWRQAAERVELAIYLGQERLHLLPFTPLEYAEAGLALGFVELWQLCFIAEAEQPPYAEAIDTVVHQIRHFFPQGLASLPSHLLTRPVSAGPRPGPDYRALFETTAARLRAVPGIHFFRAPALQPGVCLGVLERARRELGFALPAEILAFYRQLNGSQLDWRLTTDDQAAQHETYVEGSLTFWPLEKVLGGTRRESHLPWTCPPHLNVLWDREHQDSVPGLASFRPFETLRGNVPLAGFSLPTIPDEPVRMFVLGGEHQDDLIPLSLCFTTYLMASFAYAGLDYWQRYYWEASASTGSEPLYTEHILPTLIKMGFDTTGLTFR